MNDRFLEPDVALSDPTALLLGYLQAYRDALLRKVEGLDDDQLRSSVLPSGWTPLELIKHLAYVERRWIQWGFLGIDLPDPWGDRDHDQQRWQVGAEESLDQVVAQLAAQAAETTRVLAEHSLEEHANPGGRFQQDPPTLGWIGFHLLQEYARHVGQLDVVRELIDRTTGE